MGMVQLTRVNVRRPCGLKLHEVPGCITGTFLFERGTSCQTQVIKLSDAVQPLPREVTCCVHGAAPGFVTAGAAKTHAPDGSGRRFSKGAYCLAKVVWGKGW